MSLPEKEIPELLNHPAHFSQQHLCRALQQPMDWYTHKRITSVRFHGNQIAIQRGATLHWYS